MIFPKTIFDYITIEENAYKIQEVRIFDNFSWNMASHILTSISFKLGRFISAINDLKQKPPFRNIILPILRLRYRAEDIDVKDVVLYVENPEKYHLSFLVKKYYEDVFLRENDLDAFFDKAKEEKIDLGGVLVQKGEKAVPEVLPLQSIAFCDQTDILGGPIGFKFNFSPKGLKAKAKVGWGDKKNGATATLDELIALAQAGKDAPGTQNQSNKTSGVNIEVYMVRGELPESYLDEKKSNEEYVNQLQIVAFYKNKKGRQGIILYRAEDKDSVLKFHNPESIYGRALGLGGVEELFDAQIWTNFAEICKTNLLKAASKIAFWTDDEAYATRNKIKNLENLEITTVDAKSRGIQQIPNASPNVALFTQALSEWENHARELGGATDPLLGKQPPAGTPFRLQERVVFEGKGLHIYRMGKFAKFVEEIYRDWIIPHIAREIVKGKKFLATLTEEEMRFVADRMAQNKVSEFIKERMLSGWLVSQEEIKAEKQKATTEFYKNGNKKFLEILKDEFRDVELTVKVVVANKQKDLSQVVDKLVNVVRQYLVTPQLRQDPVAIKLLNSILEASGLSPLEFGDVLAGGPMTPTAQPVNMQAIAPLKESPKREAVMQ